MREVKDTKRATVRVGYDGKVYKKYLGSGAELRYNNEVKVLKYLASQGCNFVPRLLEEDPETLSIVTSNCGQIVQKMSEDKKNAMFHSLEQFGIEHGDPFTRNITYDDRMGRFCIIDFEFATNLSTGEGLKLEDIKNPRQLS